MKICLPTVGKNGLEENVLEHFGSASFFTIYDTELKSFQIVQNTNQHHSHGSCHPLGVISKYNIDVVITKGMGKRAVQLLNENNIKVYLLNGDNVKEAIEKFEANELVELTFENACGHHGCH